jgi:signal transduction histidine kinase/CheY-like chemotaxis protein
VSDLLNRHVRRDLSGSALHDCRGVTGPSWATLSIAMMSLGSRLLTARGVCIATGLYAGAGGTLSLLGWILGIPRLTSWDGYGITIKVNAALCATTAGLALVLIALGPRPNRLVRVLASSAALIGGLTLLEHLTGVDFGIDTLLFDEPAGARATTAPGRMGPPAATSFLSVGVCLWLVTGGPRARRLASGLTFVPIAIAMLGITGHLFGASQLYAVARLTGIALQTSTMIAALGVGLVAAVPERGLAALLRRDDPGGAIFRRLIVPIVVIPLVLGWLRIVGQHAGHYDLAFGTAARTLLEIVLLVGLLWWTASGISRHSLAARQSEDALRQADRLKDEFLATLAHELRNPLSPLHTGVELMRRAPHDGAIATRTLAMMDRQLVHMTRLVDDLLDISRISRGNIELRRERIELGAVIESAVETSRPVIEASAHQFVIAQPSEPVFIDGDVTRLAQVVANLLNNAAKFTDRGGRIELEVKRDGGEALVIVRDNGGGIAASALPRIFEMFTRAVSPFERAPAGGLGIGLAIARRLVDMHGGTIEVNSPPLQATPNGSARRGTGSEFIVHLPMAASVVHRAEQAQPPVVVSAAKSGLRILVADDNVDAADSIAELLEDMGHDVSMVHDGKAAVETTAVFRPHLAFVDIGMPELNGYEVASRIRAEVWGKDVVLIALTGWGQAEDRRKSTAAGFDRHIVKPINLALLEQVLVDAGQRTWAAPADAISPDARA